MFRIACLTVALAFGAFVAHAPMAHAQSAPIAPAHGASLSASSILAEEAPDLHRMLDSMGMYEIIRLMSIENTRGASDLEEQLFPGAGGPAWYAAVAGLHDVDRMIGLFEAAFNRDALTAQQIAAFHAFVTSDAGVRVVEGELAAREVFLDQSEVEAANEVFRAAIEAADPRLDILHRFNEVNGLIERNVSGALNLRFAFYRGLIDGGAFESDVPESVMLAEVWAQEPDVRHLTVEWLFSYQLTAYAGASDADMEAYVAMSESDAGRAVNAALFAAFDEMLASLSYDMGLAAAGFVAGEDI